MKDLLKGIYAFADLLLKSIVSLFSVLFFSRYHINSLNKVKTNGGDECLVLGNGPSLKKDIQENKETLKTKTTLVVNNFCNDPFFFELKPLLYIVIDPAYFRKPETDNDAKQFVQAMQKVEWAMTLIVPHEFKKSKTRSLINNNKISYIYINIVPISGFKSLSHCLYKMNLGMPLPQNVLNAAIFCAINLKFKTIKILGADHSWTKDVGVYNNNKVCYVENHFYDNEKTYREIEGFTISTFLLALSKAFDSHMKLRAYADTCGCRIINCTPESFIDAYERGNI